jgi:hypothetical protein
MAKQKIVIRDFSGGIATTSEKKDVANSARFSKNLNPFEDPAYITLARKPTKVSGVLVTALPTWAEDGSPFSTSRYFYAEDGKIHQETSGAVWSTLRTVSGGAGEGFKVFDDFLYYALGSELGRYGKLTGTPAFDDAFLSDGTMDADQSGGSTGQTYATATPINETALHRQTFTPERDPLKAITIDVNDTGDDPDWTLTVHDAYDNTIGSKTIAFASVATGDLVFTFATPLRVIIGNEYHFHITTSTTTGAPKVTTGTTTDLEDAEFSTTFGILIDSTFHPMVSLEDTLIIGNERYLATWNQSEYNPNMVALEPGFEVRALAKFEEFVVAAAIKGGSVTGGEEARLYFWDGIVASTIVSYNYYVDVTAGMPNSIFNSKGELLGVYGNFGKMCKGTAPFQDIVSKMPKLTRGKYITVYPGAMTEYEGRTLIGVSGVTDDGTNLEQGVYEYGKQFSYLPDAFNFPYTISTGTTKSATLKIGLVKSMGTDLYIGWRDAATYGVDKIALGDSAYGSGTWESLIFDGGNPEKQMLPITLKITFEPLTTGQSVTPKYKLDRATSFTSGTAASTVGDTSVEWPIYTRCREIEFAFDLASSSYTFVKITSVTLEYDDLAEED